MAGGRPREGIRRDPDLQPCPRGGGGDRERARADPRAPRGHRRRRRVHRRHRGARRPPARPAPALRAPGARRRVVRAQRGHRRRHRRSRLLPGLRRPVETREDRDRSRGASPTPGGRRRLQRPRKARGRHRRALVHAPHARVRAAARRPRLSGGIAAAVAGAVPVPAPGDPHQDARAHGAARCESLLYLDRPLAVIRVSTDSLRRGDQERGELTMLQLLAAEYHRLSDPEARRAAAAGIVERAKHLSWYYRDTGRRRDAMGTCLSAFRVVGDAELLLRALMVWGPEDPRRYFARMLPTRMGRLLWYGVLSGSLV